MTPETYYTIRRILSPCGPRSEVLSDLTYRRVWRPEVRNSAMRVSGATFWLTRGSWGRPIPRLGDYIGLSPLFGMMIMHLTQMVDKRVVEVWKYSLNIGFQN